jgi:hypothetical protein
VIRRRAHPLVSLAVGAVFSAPIVVGALALDSCAHAQPRGACEQTASACPGGLAVCASNGEASCVAQQEDDSQ